MKPHPHAELIKRWADGELIQRYAGSGEWVNVPLPTWDIGTSFRVKPAEPERSYPVTQMCLGEFMDIWDNKAQGCGPRSKARMIANAALRHACDNGQIVTREEFDRAVGDRAKRDMAVAKEVVKSLCWVFSSTIDHKFNEDYLIPVIARANATKE